MRYSPRRAYSDFFVMVKAALESKGLLDLATIVAGVLALIAISPVYFMVSTIIISWFAPPVWLAVRGFFFKAT